MNKILTILLAFVVILAGVVYVFWQRNTYSKEELKLEMFGPAQAEVGAEVEYIVKFKNNGDFRLESPNLIFEAPDFSIKDDALYTKESLDSTRLGGDIYPGEERSFSFKIHLIGKEGDTKIAKASMTYQPKNLKVRYESDTTFTTIIKDVPLDFSFDLPSQIETDKNFNFHLNYSSNANWLLTNLRITVDYPTGFEFIQSSPKSINKTEWDIPVLNNGAAGSVDVTGQLSGDVGDAKVFRARIGMWQNGQYMALKEIEKGVQINKPSVQLSQQINSSTGYTAKPGDWLHYQITYKNVSDSDQYNLVMINKLDGDLFDLTSIKSDTASFQSGDSSIIFDGSKNSSLQYLPTMGQGIVEFWVKLKDNAPITKPQIVNHVAIGAAREDFTTQVSAKIDFTQKAYYNDEIFGNTGPFPPKVGQPTTYTVTWLLKNYFSAASGVKIVATLPDNAQWNGNVFPDTAAANLAYDNSTRQIAWNLGDLKVGQGVLTEPPNVSFQVTLTPNSDQAGTKAPLISLARVQGTDATDSSALDISAPALDTGTLSDQNMTDTLGQVTN